MKMIESLKQRWILWVWNHTPSCAEMSRLTSQSFEQSPPLGMRLKMRLHYLICAWCRRYGRHLQFLRIAAARLDQHQHIPTALGLPAEAKQRIVHRLQAG
jgi:hypothetical protein